MMYDDDDDDEYLNQLQVMMKEFHLLQYVRFRY